MNHVSELDYDKNPSRSKQDYYTNLAAELGFYMRIISLKFIFWLFLLKVIICYGFDIRAFWNILKMDK